MLAMFMRQYFVLLLVWYAPASQRGLLFDTGACHSAALVFLNHSRTPETIVVCGLQQVSLIENRLKGAHRALPTIGRHT